MVKQAGEGVGGSGSAGKRISLVLGGGGMKGFAHIGVLRALEERGIKPSLYAGTSIGALIAAAAVGGMTVAEMARRAESLRRRDLFRINHFGMLLERMRSPSIYLEEPLRDLCRSIVPPLRFRDLRLPLLVNTVDVERGAQVVWGLPGLRDVAVQDAVYASCALPGYFPPGEVDGRLCVDGGVIDNLPVAISSMDADLVIAVDVGSSDLAPIKDLASKGFASIYMRAATTMMHALQGYPLQHWGGPPMILIRPKVGSDWLSFGNAEKTMDEGYRKASLALQDFEAALEQPGGVYPRRLVAIDVDRERCIGCGLCAALAPAIMGMDASRKAFARTRTADWSTADGDFVHHCPTGAIEVRKIERLTPSSSAPAQKQNATEDAA
jgi:NTE family protein